MSLITATNLSKSFGPDDIFRGVSLAIPRKARIGLVGANGIGKTTLLRILVGLDEASAGDVQRAKGLRMGYLPQETSFTKQHTLWEECLTAFQHVSDLQNQMALLEKQLNDTPEGQAALASYSRLQSEYEHAGGYTFETRIRQTLSGLGFTRSEENRSLKQLSGGQRTRALLARLLLENPDILMMDEPTNHLDISAVEWLEDYIKEWSGAVLIVSHDRYFLDQVVTSIMEMTPALETYRGNYTAYAMQREQRHIHQMEEFQKQQEFIEKQEDYIRRNIAGQNTRQAKGRLKRLERMLSETTLLPPDQQRSMRLKLKPVSRSGDLVLRTYGVGVGYKDDGKVLFNVPDLTLTRGECAAIIGPNGAGKTTFLKTILGQIPPLMGETQLGASLQIGYFAQAHEGLHDDWSLMQEIEALAPKKLPAEIRNYLASFLFTGDDVFRPVSSLSGGERGRLALACLSLQGANLLLLDEPTNHLDLPSQDILQSILSEFNGTILLVSHDRYLIDALATQIWEVFPDSRELKVFKGSYTEYRLSKQRELEDLDRGSIKGVKPAKPKASGISKEERRKRQEKIAGLEEEIDQTERDLELISKQLGSMPKDSRRIFSLSKEYESLQRLLENRISEWEVLSKQLEACE
jgi:ATP-binding cassette subfamily F protein 3